MPTSISHLVSKPLKVLIVEDSPADAELVVRELERSHGNFTWQRVDCLGDVELALVSEPDLIICDIFLPALDGREVISLVRSRLPQAGIIAVTGEMGDHEAAALLAGGADDYLLKDRLGRLGGAIERILNNRRQKERSEASLGEAQRRTRSLFVSNPEAVIELGMDGALVDANPAAEQMLGAKTIVLRAFRFDHFVSPASQARAWEAFRTSMAGVSRALEVVVLRIDRREILVKAHTIPINVQDTVVGMYVVATDVTKAREMEATARLAERVIENIAEGMMVFDSDFNLISVNPAFEQILGWNFEELGGQAPDFLNEHGPEAGLASDIRLALAGRGVWQGEVQWRRRSGDRFPALVSFSTVREEAGPASHYVCVFTDITASRDFENRLAFLARHDVLTQLANRAEFQEQLSSVIAAARKNETGIGVVFLDLDNFKSVNDSLGHDAGDRLLQSVAARLRECVSEQDLVARFGGDDFGVVLADINGPDDCTRFMECLMDGLAAPFLLDGHELYATCSAGISLYPQDGTSGAVLMSNADIAMYRAKDHGRNTFQFFSREMNEAALDNLLLANGLRVAIEHSELVLHYQPRYETATGRMTGVEALIRWNHPDRGLVMPGEFVPIAESTGFVGTMGEWALREACRQAVIWHREGRQGLRMAVNLSVRQLEDPGLVPRIRDILSESGLPADMLELEVTESMLMSDPERAGDTLALLNQLGVHIAIDDFGTGYSSLSYLKRFTINDLKIDRAFVRDLPEDEDDAAIVRAIIAVAQSLGIRTVAEGVETQAQFEFLKGLACDEVQGYLFSRPVPASELPAE